MIFLITQLVVWLNALANAVGGLLLAPLGVLPGWLSATFVAIITGVGLLIVFKYTSNQRAIKRVKDDIKANLLALKLFKENPAVTLGAQGRIMAAALRLMVLAIVPMLVMVVPVLLMLGQLSLWYQGRPLRVGEAALVTMTLNEDAVPLPDVQLKPTDAFAVAIGPVRVPSKREVCWSIEARQPGEHRLMLQVGGQTAEKQFAVGDRLMRISALRPGWSWSDALMYPAERPFAADSSIRSIAIDYPTRSSWTSGADSWVVYWFAVSMVAGFAFRGLFNVNM
ncbi:MAG TPA: hypothetical protein VJ783_16200 [Pirellulales bacterium]|nr:hypothetical protein [Pirellulales bacterium]